MSKKRHKPEEIVAKLRQVGIVVGQGRNRTDAIREIGVTEQRFYRKLPQLRHRTKLEITVRRLT